MFFINCYFNFTCYCKLYYYYCKHLNFNLEVNKVIDYLLYYLNFLNCFNNFNSISKLFRYLIKILNSLYQNCQSYA